MARWKSTVWLQIVTIVWWSSSAWGTQPQPFLTHQDIYTGGLDGVNIYRIPTLIVSKTGTILAFCEAREGDDGSPTDIVLKRSTLNERPVPSKDLNGYQRTFGYGFNWDRMRVVLPGNGNGAMQTTPVVDRDSGTIWLCCYMAIGGSAAHYKDSYAGRVVLTKSVDDGQTWSAPIDVTEAVGPFNAGPGVGIQLSDGRMVIPGYGRDGSRVIFSDDHGQTWKSGAPVDNKQTDESQVVELANGSLMMNMRRPEGGCRYIAISKDRGETWNAGRHDETLPDPSCQASLVRFVDRNHGSRGPLLFSNPPHRGPFEARTGLTVRLSDDEGNSWKVVRQVNPGPGAYSCLASLADGTIGLLYETGQHHPYEKITFARFNLEWLKEGGLHQ